MTKRILALILSTMLLLPLAACGGGAPVSSDVSDVPVPDTTTTTTTVPTTTTTTAAPTTTTTTTAAPATTTTAPLTAEQKRELQIKQDYVAYMHKQDSSYAKYTVDDVYIGKYYGTWNGALALSIDFSFGYLAVMGYYDILGYRLEVDSGYMARFELYKNGEFKGIQAAYDAGWISKADGEDILRKHFNLDRQIKTEEVKRLALAFLQEQYPDGSDVFGDVSQLTVSDVYVEESGVEYDGFERFFVNVSSIYFVPDKSPLTGVELAGYTFTIDRQVWSNQFIYKDGEVKHLPQAYEAGWVTRADVYKMLERYWKDLQE